MSMYRIRLDAEGAMALREFAEVMPLAIENISQSTETLFRVYQSVADRVGPHEHDFENMLLLIKSAQENAAEAITVLPSMLQKTADKIDAYNAARPTISGN